MFYIFHLFLSVSLKNLVNRTEPNFLRIKMYPDKVICEILEEFCGVTAPRKIRSFEESEPECMYAKDWKVWILVKFELDFLSGLRIYKFLWMWFIDPLLVNILLKFEEDSNKMDFWGIFYYLVFLTALSKASMLPH